MADKFQDEVEYVESSKAESKDFSDGFNYAIKCMRFWTITLYPGAGAGAFLAKVVNEELDRLQLERDIA